MDTINTEELMSKRVSLAVISLFLLLLIISSQSKAQTTQLNPKWEQWVKNNTLELSLTDTVNFQDLSFFNKLLKEKRVVFLGENSHGVAEYTLLKSRMIRYLHDSLGFNVLVFETNGGDAFAANRTIPTSDINTCIYNSISTLWHVEEIVPLFGYIRKTQTTNNPLNIAGIDITMSNGGYSFSKFLYKLIQPVDPKYAKEVAKNDSLFSRLGVRQWTIGNIIGADEKEYRTKIENNQIENYRELISFIDQNLQSFPKEMSTCLLPAIHYIQSRIEYIYFRKNDSTYMANALKLTNSKMSLAKLRSNFRDYMMSQNLQFLVEDLYPNEKIIVWAQDAHITKWNYRMPANKSYSKQAYTIGVFCFSGKGSYGQGFDGTNPDSLIYTFETPKDFNSIEKILHSSGHENTFLDLTSLNKTEGNSWAFESSEFHQWDGRNIEEVNDIRTVYDGLIVVGTISPPKFLKYNYEYLDKK
jgi:erythromycin esterase